MLKLYHFPISFNSRRVWIALLEKQVDFELIDVNLGGDQFKPEFLEMNPFHHIPVLKDGDFSVIESLAILDYIEAKYPEPSLLPKDPKSIAIVRMVEMVTINELVPKIRPLIQEAMGFSKQDEKTLKQAKENVGKVLTYFEKLLDNRSYFVENQLTLAEVVAGSVIPIFPNFGISIKEYPNITAWIKHLMARESWKKTNPSQEAIEAFKSQMKKLMSKA